MITKTKLAIFSGLMLFALYSFQPVRKLTDRLIGTWLLSNNENSISTYTVAKDLNKYSRGIEFKKGGNLLIRANDAACQDPTGYATYSGRWNITSDSVLSISYTDKSWVIEKEKTWKIVSLAPSKLTVRKITCRKTAKDNM